MAQLTQILHKYKKYILLSVLVMLTAVFLLLFAVPLNGPSFILSRARQKSPNFDHVDYNHLININFSFKVLPIVCDSDGPLLLVLVHTSADNFNKRQIIRETWGQNETDTKVLFLVGIAEELETQKKIQDEVKQHDDLVQGNFIDTYHNLTYKHVMALKYALYHCPKAEFVLKVDDDVFVNIPNVKNFIFAYKCQKGSLQKIFCLRLFTPPVLREGKWEVSEKDYPETNYPTHCLGFAILYPHDTLPTLYLEAQKTKFFWIDDVHVTGIIARNSNISHVGIDRLVLSTEDVQNAVNLDYDAITIPFLFGRINLDEKEIRSLWDFVVKRTPKTNILDYLSY